MNFRKAKHLFKRCGGGIFKENLYEKERLYKHKLKSARNCHTLDMRKKLQYLRTYNPKEYWKILNANCTHKECKVDLSNLYLFYEKCCNTAVEGESEHVLSAEELNTLSDLKLNDSINQPITHDEITNVSIL